MGIKINVIQDKRKTSNNLWYGKALMMQTLDSRASGHSAMYWINRAIVLRAKVLLHTTDLLTYEIAERLHFANPPAFNNFFKRETGLTPKEYRRT